MIANSTRQAYSEIDSFIKLLDEEKQNKIPIELRELFSKEKDKNYNKIILADVPIKDQNLKRETLALIAYLNLQYWCEDEEEKQRLMKIYKDNEKKYNDEMMNRLNNFNAVSAKPNSEVKKEEENTKIAEYKEESLLTKIINKLKSIFNKNRG